MRAAAVAGCALLGAVVAVLGIAVHRLAWRVGDVALPWGLALAILPVLACAYGAGLLVGRRAGTLAFGLGWLGALLFVLQGRPEGDFVLAGDWLGWSFLALGGGSLAITMGLALGGGPDR